MEDIVKAIVAIIVLALIFLLFRQMTDNFTNWDVTTWLNAFHSVSGDIFMPSRGLL